MYNIFYQFNILYYLYQLYILCYYNSVIGLYSLMGGRFLFQGRRGERAWPDLPPSCPLEGFLLASRCRPPVFSPAFVTGPFWGSPKNPPEEEGRRCTGVCFLRERREEEHLFFGRAIPEKKVQGMDLSARLDQFPRMHGVGHRHAGIPPSFSTKEERGALLLQTVRRGLIPGPGRKT